MYDLKKIGDRIKEARTEQGMTLDDVAKRVGVARSTIQRYEVAKIISPKDPVLVAIANAFGVNPDWLRGKSEIKDFSAEEEKYLNRTPIPVLVSISADGEIYTEENICGYVFEDNGNLKYGSEYIYLKVHGDSMYPELKEGDTIFVECGARIESGSYGVVIVDEEQGTVKRIVYGNDFIELQSVNPMYPPRKFKGEEIKRVRIFGKVKGMRRIY